MDITCVETSILEKQVIPDNFYGTILNHELIDKLSISDSNCNERLEALQEVLKGINRRRVNAFKNSGDSSICKGPLDIHLYRSLSFILSKVFSRWGQDSGGDFRLAIGEILLPSGTDISPVEILTRLKFLFEHLTTDTPDFVRDLVVELLDRILEQYSINHVLTRCAEDTTLPGSEASYIWETCTDIISRLPTVMLNTQSSVFHRVRLVGEIY